MRKRKGGGGLCFENWLGHALLPELVGVIYIYPFFEPSLPTPELSNFNKIADMASAVPATGRELSNPPLDGITNLRFSNHSDHLLVSSWDKVCMYAPLSLFSLFIQLVYVYHWFVCVWWWFYLEREVVWCQCQCLERRVYARWSRPRLLLPRWFLRIQCRRRQHC